MKETLRQQIEALRELKTKALKEKYRELLGEDSRSSNPAHLFRRLAWRLQALEQGSLSDRARERANHLAADANLRLRAPGTFWKELDTAAPDSRASRDPRLPPAGTELMRKYKGQFIRVRVYEDSFEYQSRRYGSLSAIAYRATGTRWNGFSFFGLNKTSAE